MDRRAFLKTTGAAAGAAAVPIAVTSASDAVATPAVTKGLRQLSLASQFPSDWPVLGDFTARLARRVAMLSDSRLTLAISIPDKPQHTEAADVCLGSPCALAPLDVTFEMLAGVPEGLTGDHIDGWLGVGGGRALWDDLAFSYGRKMLYAGRSGGAGGFWLREHLPVRPVIAAAGTVARALAGLGVRTASQAEAQAGKSVSIDGVEGLAPMVDLASGLTESLPIHVTAGLPGAERIFALHMDAALWHGLATGEQILLETAVAAEAAQVAATLVAHAPMALATIAARSGRTGTAPPPELTRLLPDAAARSKLRDDLLDWYAQQSPAARRIAGSYRAFVHLVSGSSDRLSPLA